MKRLVFAGMVLLLATGSVFSQTCVVIPAGLDQKEGNAASFVPTKYSPSRAQYLYSAGVMPNLSIAIKSFRLRRDGESPLAFLAFSQEVEVYMGHPKGDPAAGYSRLWADNRGLDHTCVLKKTMVNYPTLGPVTKGPAPFVGSVSFTLDKPFTYQPTKPFMIEFVTFAQNMVVTGWLADAEDEASWNGHPTGGARIYSGSSCPTNFGSYGEIPYIGYRWWHYGYCQSTASGIAAFDLIGFNKSKLGSLALPFDLTPIGAPGCSLQVAPLIIKAGYIAPNTHTGLVIFELGTLPNNVSLVGAVYHEQQLVIDSAFNSLGVRLSRLASCTIGGGFTGSPPGFQLIGYGPSFQGHQDWADWYGARSLVVELKY